MLAYILAIPLLAHALANLAGVFAPWMKSLFGFVNTAWIFSNNVIYASVVGRVFSLLWLASTICLATGGFGLLTHQSWWLKLVILGCTFSALAILPWWKAVPAGARFGGIFDLLVILLLLSPIGAKIVQAVE